MKKNTIICQKKMYVFSPKFHNISNDYENEIKSHFAEIRYEIRSGQKENDLVRFCCLSLEVIVTE